MNRNEYYNALAHHGIGGMKWGKKNGPPYPLSAGAHSSSERASGTKGWSKEAKKETNKEKVKKMSDEELQKENKRSALENQYLKNNPDRNRSLEIAENTRAAANSASDLARKVEKATTKKVNTGVDISKLSDKELQQIVNRLNLEQRYDQLTTKEVANEGAVYVREAIEILGGVAGLATSGILLYSSLKSLKHGEYYMNRDEYYAYLNKAKENELEHHGIKGQHWGDRKYQNEDGSLTPAGRARYGYGEGRNAFSLKAAAYKLGAKNYELNNRTYSKGKSAQAKTIASMNKAAANDFHKKAAAAQEAANNKRNERLDAKLRKQNNKMKIRQEYAKIQANSKFGERMLYNDKTRKLEAKYVVNNNMSYEEAKKKAHAKAWRNTAAVLGVYGAYNYAILKSYQKGLKKLH